jgi:hypothetical protein
MVSRPRKQASKRSHTEGRDLSDNTLGRNPIRPLPRIVRIGSIVSKRTVFHHRECAYSVCSVSQGCRAGCVLDEISGEGVVQETVSKHWLGIGDERQNSTQRHQERALTSTFTCISPSHAYSCLTRSDTQSGSSGPTPRRCHRYTSATPSPTVNREGLISLYHLVWNRASGASLYKETLVSLLLFRSKRQWTGGEASIGLVACHTILQNFPP